MTLRVRIVVEEAATGLECGLAAGDVADVVDSTFTTRPGRPFCAQALAAVWPVLALAQQDLAPDHWLARKPFVSCGCGHALVRVDRSAHSS